MFPIVEKLGGWDAAREMLAKRGLGPTDMAVRQWKARRRLPLNVSLALQLEAKDRAIDATDADCIAVHRKPVIAAE